MHVAPPLIALTGRAMSGKDTAFGFLRELEPRIVRVAFADPLKQDVAKLFNVEVGEIEARKPLFRPVLQAYGVARRELCGSDYWIQRAGLAIQAARKAGHPVVVTDVRFCNEAAYLRSLGGVLVRISRPRFDSAVPTHVSELESDQIEVDHLVEACTPHELRAEIRAVAPRLGL